MTSSRVVVRRASANPLNQDFALSESDLAPLFSAFIYITRGPFKVESLLYGVHATLFFICVRILLGRGRSTMKAVMLTAVVVMFVLTTGDIAISWLLVLRRTSFMYTGTTLRLQRTIYPKFIIHLINNAIADCLLITRCYVVWGNRTTILYVGGFGLILATLCGIMTGVLPKIPDLIKVYFLGVLGLNFILTVVTAARIMWVAKEVKKAVGSQMASYYHFSVGILVESGLIYTASTLLWLIFKKSIYVMLATAIVLRVVCIVPILIIVQIALGKSIEDVKTTVTKLQGGTQPIVLDTMVSEGYEVEGEGNHEPFTGEDEEMRQRRASIGLSAITRKSDS